LPHFTAWLLKPACAVQRALVGLWLREPRHKKSRGEGPCSRWDGPTLWAKPPQKAWRFFSRKPNKD
jgi:hypothetical protein